MEIQYVHAIRTQLPKTDIHRLEHLVVGVRARLGRVHDLGRQRQAAVPPPGLAREGLLPAADVEARRVDLIVAARLEQVQDLVVLAQVGDARARLLVRAEGHETQDDARLGGLRYER